jgi:hypothetical protein
MKTPLVAVTLLFLSVSIPSASSASPVVEVPQLAWVSRGESILTTDPTKIVVDSVGDVIVIGGGFLTTKYSGWDGSVIWTNHHYDAGGNGYAYPIDLAADPDGNVVVAGAAQNTSGDTDIYTAKYAAASGALIWGKRYSGPADGTDQPVALGLDAQGNVVVTGNSLGEGADWDFYTAKYAAADGALLWQRRYEGPAGHEDKVAAVAVDLDGNVLVTGWSYSSHSFWSSDYYTAKYAADDGSILWEKYYDGPRGSRDRPHSIGVDQDGDVIVTGEADVSYGCVEWGCTGTGGWYTAKYRAADGTLLWERRYDNVFPGYTEHRIALTLDAGGNVLLCGGWVVEGRCPVGPCFPPVVYYSYAAKCAAADGSPLWERSWEYHTEDRDINVSLALPAGREVIADTAGNLITAEVVWDADHSEYVTSKRSAANGELIWETRYEGPGSAYDSLIAMALDRDGSVILTGVSQGNLATVKYAMTHVTYPTPVALSLALASEGARLRFTGDAGRTYRLQRASDLSGPWSTFAALTAPPDGAVEHLDPAPLGSPKFYRVAAP